MKNKQTGFTLIELLVVIAIIGILSSVVLASLNSARGKGSDAAVKEEMDNFKSQAAIYYDNNGQSYNITGATSTTCSTASTVFADPQSVPIINNVMNDSIASAIVCNSTASTFAISTTLKGAGTSWCVDSNGNSTTTTVNTGDGLCI